VSNKTPAQAPFPVDAYYREVGKNIAAARVALGMTQLELGQAVNLTRGSIAKIETGVQRHLGHMLMQIAQVLGIKSDALLPVEYRSGSKGKTKPESAVTKAEVSEVISLLDAASAKLKKINRKKNK
jgi:transcriptional regulator with XRE-family HTH domain